MKKEVEAKKIVEMAKNHDTHMAKLFADHFAKIANVDEKKEPKKDKQEKR